MNTPMITAETTSFFIVGRSLAGVRIVREIVSRFPKRISQFLNFDENLRYVPVDLRE